MDNFRDSELVKKLVRDGLRGQRAGRTGHSSPQWKIENSKLAKAVERSGVIGMSGGLFGMEGSKPSSGENRAPVSAGRFAADTFERRGSFAELDPVNGVLGIRAAAQIDDTIVGLHPINVVNLPIRPISKMDGPSNPVGQKAPAKNLNLDVPLGVRGTSHNADKVRVPLTGRLPPEDAGFRVIAEGVAKVLDRDHLSGLQIGDGANARKSAQRHQPAAQGGKQPMAKKNGARTPFLYVIDGGRKD